MTGADQPDASDLLLPDPVDSTLSFNRYGAIGDAIPSGPVIISVPHAGRYYPTTLLSQSRVPPSVLRRLEDRYADVLAIGLVRQGYDVLIARTARAVIDLNRNEREIDPIMVRDLPYGTPLSASAKLRGGLGLFPRRLHGANELWRRPFNWDDLRGRIAQFHVPYHATLNAMMQRARDVHGYAMLIDLHSMPPLAPSAYEAAPQIVLGDGFGRSASPRLISRAADVFDRYGLKVAQNAPYPGNYLIGRHGRPEANMHALQIEVDRTLYLDSTLEHLGQGVTALQAMLVDLAANLADEWPTPAFAQAAE